MKSDKSNPMSEVSTRQKVTIGLFLVVIIIIIWQVIGLFKGSSEDSNQQHMMQAGDNTNIPGGSHPPMVTPKPEVIPQQTLTPADMAVLRQQQELEAKYLEALNQLQVLRVDKEIAETNQAIAKAKLETVTAQKSIVGMLAPPPVPTSSYAEALSTPGQVQTPPRPAAPAPQQQNTEVNYNVISVSLLQNKWSAVIGYQGNLYHVSAGDILPADQSIVISVDNTGVILEKDGQRRKVSIVSII